MTQSEFNFEAEAEETPGEAEQQPDPSAELRAELERMKADNLALRRQMTEQAFRVQTQPQAPKLDLQGLDPAAEDYHPQLTQRIDGYVDARLQPVQQQQAQLTEAEQAAALLQQFQVKYADRGWDHERALAAASLAWQKGERKGIDMHRYVSSMPELFFEDMAAEGDRLFSKAAPQKKADTEADMDSRTMGLFGGTESMGRPTGGAEKAEKLGSLTGDLRQWQTAHGLI